LSTARRLDAIVFGNFLALGIVLAAVPRYLHLQLHATRFATGLATTIYFVAALIVRPFIGAAVDRVGRRPFLIVPPFFTAAITLLYLTAKSVVAVAVLRFVGGAFAAVFFTALILAATDLVPPDRRTQALGRQSVLTYTGFIIGPIITDRLLDHGWRIVWIVPAAIHVLVSLVAFTLPETRSAEAPISTARPGFDRRVVRPAMGLLAANFGFAAIVTFSAEYSERMGIRRPGTMLAVYAVAVLMVRAATGRAADRIGPARFILPCLSTGGIALVALALANVPWQAYVSVAVVGASLGATFPAATSASLTRTGTGDRGKAMGTVLALGDIGQASAGPLIGYLSGVWGFRWVYLIPALVCVVAISAVASMPELRRRPMPEAAYRITGEA
jgi:MFS family permease